MRLKHFILLACVPVIWLGCGSKSTQPTHKTNHEHLNKTIDRSGPEYTSAYICPMHCEGSGSDTTGICPVCKMDYVKNESK